LMPKDTALSLCSVTPAKSSLTGSYTHEGTPMPQQSSGHCDILNCAAEQPDNKGPHCSEKLHKLYHALSLHPQAALLSVTQLQTTTGSLPGPMWEAAKDVTPCIAVFSSGESMRSFSQAPLPQSGAFPQSEWSIFVYERRRACSQPCLLVSSIKITPFPISSCHTGSYDFYALTELVTLFPTPLLLSL
jgi:hypothetical protein